MNEHKCSVTTLYDEHPFGDGFSLSVIITSVILHSGKNAKK